MISPDDELEIACLVDIGTSCRGLELLAQTGRALKDARTEIKALKEWIKVLERQIERYKR